MTVDRAASPLAADAAAFRIERFAVLPSTNAEALDRAAAGDPGGLWIRADAQTLGRGRAGRAWTSPPGNLYASLLLRPACAPSAAPGLSLLAAVAAADAVAAMRPAAAPRIALKWPNDILIEGAKAGGVLLESMGSTGPGRAVVIGVGVNVASPPSGLDRPVAHARAFAPDATVDRVFDALVAAMAGWLRRWDDGRGFGAVRNAWLARAYGLGAPVSVRVNGSVVAGVFLGLDDDGALLLADSAGAGERRVTAGDVCF
ncbi:MAG: biotin--[acetyl-CoA-carboxylase] ligase [Hyphomicrobiales bacterium]|nr:biotin--[acetyl-CoA-carboxylase] ligase [Hyphomicrobiales bacterium]